MPPAEPPVFTKGYDLVLALFPETMKFPRVYRPSLGARLQASAVELLAAITSARYGQERVKHLRRADAEVAVMKVMVRLSKDLKCVSPGRYLQLAGRLDELGRMIGGWMKSERERGEPTG